MLSDDCTRHRLLFDLRKLGMPVDEVSIYFRPYSKTLYGRYYPATDLLRPRIFLYPYEDRGNNSYIGYDTILKTAIHEFCHHLQYTQKDFVRVKGVMHNEQFWEMYNHYVAEARKQKMLVTSIWDLSVS